MKIFGKNIKKDELNKRIGDITQLGGIKYYEFIDGVSKGVRGIDIKSPCGLDFTVIPDRGIDISSMSYKSIPIAWKSTTRETSPIYYESRGLEWLRTFYGGLLTTCGLSTFGPPSIDNNEEFGLHGRISNIAGERILADGRWEGDRYRMWIQGRLRESRIFGDKLELSRKITTWMDQPVLTLEDVVENIGTRTSLLMILYHVNIGYPIIDKDSKLIEPEAKVIARDKEAERGIDSFSNFIKPIEGFNEQVFFHDIKPDKEGNGNIAIINENFNNGEGIGIWLKYNKNNLPNLIQWKQMGEGEYVCGIEPSNSYLRGRYIERKEKAVRYIEPGQKIKFRLEFNILKDGNDIDDIKKLFKAITGMV